jgi:hypothetical protein
MPCPLHDRPDRAECKRRWFGGKAGSVGSWPRCQVKSHAGTAIFGFLWEYRAKLHLYPAYLLAYEKYCLQYIFLSNSLETSAAGKNRSAVSAANMAPL